MREFKAIILEPRFFGLLKTERECVVYGWDIRSAVRRFRVCYPRAELKMIWG